VFAPGDKALLDFAASFHRIVVLSRRDKLGQAISGTLAQVTGTWFNDGTPPDIDPSRWPQLFPAIAANLARYIEEDRRLAALGKALARPWLRIEYEEILRDGKLRSSNSSSFSASVNPWSSRKQTTSRCRRSSPSKLPRRSARGSCNISAAAEPVLPSLRQVFS